MRWARDQLFAAGSLRVPLAVRRYFTTETTPGRWLTQRHNGPEGSRQYDVYLPAGLPAKGKVPMVLLLTPSITNGPPLLVTR